MKNFFYSKNRIAIVANGQEIVTDEIITAIKSSRIIIAVDGGLNFCDKYHISVHYLIGDLDSVDVSLVKHLKIIVLERAKEITDLEAAIQLAYKLDRRITPFLFNILGGRKDHHINNLYLLMKYPRTIAMTKDIVIKKAINCKDIVKDIPLYRSFLFAYYDEGDIQIGTEKILLRKGDCIELTKKIGRINIQKGNIFLIYKKFFPRFSFPAEIFPLENVTFPYYDENEDIFLLNASNPVVEIDTKLGLVISLIPWGGKVEGIQTEGLKWNLKGNDMHKEFTGISNIALGKYVKVAVRKGNLLCIIEKTIIDREMIYLEDCFSMIT